MRSGRKSNSDFHVTRVIVVTTGKVPPCAAVVAFPNKNVAVRAKSISDRTATVTIPCASCIGASCRVRNAGMRSWRWRGDPSRSWRRRCSGHPNRRCGPRCGLWRSLYVTLESVVVAPEIKQSATIAARPGKHVAIAAERVARSAATIVVQGTIQSHAGGWVVDACVGSR